MAPERPFYAVGDIHGCFGAMKQAFGKIDKDIDINNIVDPVVVMLGDYVDRGEESAQVLEHLMSLSKTEGDALVCLKGNHEQLLLNFIDDPAKSGRRWLKFGGLQALASFRIGGLTELANEEQLYGAAEELVDAMPDGMLEWLRGLPLMWHSGNMHCVHAAMEPDIPVTQQSEKVLMWGCQSFEQHTRTDGNWVVHGHTIVDAPRIEFGRVSLDTGCYYSGRLTAAAFTGPECRILE